MERAFQPATYLLASQRRGTLYVGVTSDLVQRVWQHRNHQIKGFTDRYNVTMLVWYQLHPTMEIAIAREKAIKQWKRAWKLELIETMNANWRDLWDEISGGDGDPTSGDEDRNGSRSSTHQKNCRHPRESEDPC